MPARRTSQPLKLLLHGQDRAAAAVALDAEIGGNGIDWTVEPADLLDESLTEWRRLAQVYGPMPTRFREGDRAILVAYCVTWELYLISSRMLRRDGLLVDGRSAPDRGRAVKNPALMAWRDSAGQLRQLARELGLSPDARGRLGLVEKPEPVSDRDNPFAGGA